MSKEKQILHMLLDGYSQRRIASTLCVSRNTVAKVAKAASDHQLSKDALESMEEMEIHNWIFLCGSTAVPEERGSSAYFGIYTLGRYISFASNN